MSQDSQIAQTDRVLTKRELPRLRFQYGKDERLAFLGHLEVIGTIDRCVRRARLPFSIGNGFARRMRIQFSQALPVGASSCCEYFDVKLTARIDAVEALAMLAAATPAALAPVAAAYVDEPQGALEAWLTRAAWEVEVLGAPVGAAELSSAIEGLVHAAGGPHLPARREGEAHRPLAGPRGLLRSRRRRIHCPCAGHALLKRRCAPAARARRGGPCPPGGGLVRLGARPQVRPVARG